MLSNELQAPSPGLALVLGKQWWGRGEKPPGHLPQDTASQKAGVPSGLSVPLLWELTV